MRTCSVDGCGRKVHGRGLCSAHWYRQRKYGDPLAGPTEKGALLKFYRDVVLNYDGDDCLLWPFARSEGRAVMDFEGRKRLVSRLVCAVDHGEPPTAEHEAAHSCGKGHLGCVNRKHLRWATHAENLGDRVIHGTTNDGSRNGQAKLNEGQARQIIALKGTASHSEIAQRFGVNRVTVTDILSGRRWRSVLPLHAVGL